MASYQSAALRSAPGYAPRPSAIAAYSPNIPQVGPLPAVPALAQDASTPGYLQRQLLANQLGQLGGQQNAASTGIQAQAKQALAGYGGYQFQQDNPNTSQREDLLLNYDASKGMGEREKAAYKSTANQANSAGMLESSFANQNIASAVQRVSLEAQQIANQYAAAINQTATQFANQAASISSEWAGLYGQDSAWLVQNPPPVPYGKNQADLIDYQTQQQAAHPGTTPQQAATYGNFMTYADFLKGRKSTKSLAQAWDERFNGGKMAAAGKFG